MSVGSFMVEIYFGKTRFYYVSRQNFPKIKMANSSREKYLISILRCGKNLRDVGEKLVKTGLLLRLQIIWILMGSVKTLGERAWGNHSGI